MIGMHLAMVWSHDQGPWINTSILWGTVYIDIPCEPRELLKLNRDPIFKGISMKSYSTFLVAKR